MVPPRLPDGHVSALADSARPLANSSGELLDRAKRGDRAALDELVERYLPALRRWASGRLPRRVRDIADTADLLQDTLLQTFKRIDGFVPEGDGALFAYLRQAVLNRIRLEFRRERARPPRADLDSRHPDASPSPLDHAVAAELWTHYEVALERVSEHDRHLIVARLERGRSYAQIASGTGRPNANAARSAVVRALMRLADEMRHVE